MFADGCINHTQSAKTVIKRRTAHTAFTFVIAGLVGGISWQAWKLNRATKLNAALQSIPASITTEQLQNNSQPLSSHPSVQLSIGSALANSGDLEEAERTFNALISDSANQQLVNSAQFNLANAYLRQALTAGSQTTSKTLPMVELAKQRYRDLLHQAPEHWGARYNLERALTMAPEGSDSEDEERNEPVKSVNVIVPGFEKKDLP